MSTTVLVYLVYMAEHSVKCKFKSSLTVGYGSKTWHVQLNRPQQTVHTWPLLTRADTQHDLEKAALTNCVSDSKLSIARNNRLLMHGPAAGQAKLEEHHVSTHTMHHVQFKLFD